MLPRFLLRPLLGPLALSALLRGAAAQTFVEAPVYVPLPSLGAPSVLAAPQAALSSLPAPHAPDALPALPATLEPLAPLSVVAEPPSEAAPIAARPLRLLITGPPGVGKTTFGKLLAKDYGMVHISVGELLRAKAADNPALAEAMAKGELVDSNLVRQVVSERLSQDDVKTKGFILDGFPRRPEEIGVIEAWLKDGGQIDAMIHLEASDAELLRRIEARGRADDSPEVFRRRMAIYRAQTRPVLDHFQQTLPIYETQTEGPDIPANYAKVRALIEKVLSNDPQK